MHQRASVGTLGGLAIVLLGSVAIAISSCSGDDSSGTGTSGGSGGATGSSSTTTTTAGTASGGSGTTTSGAAGTATTTTGAGGDTSAGSGGAMGSGGNVTSGTAGSGGEGSGAGGTQGTGGSTGTGGSKDGGSGGTNAGDAGSCGGLVMATIPDRHCASPDGGRGDSVGPHSGTEADDDDCKYHVKISVPCIQRNENVSFTVTLTNIGTTTPATGAAPEIEGTIGTHPFPNSNPMSTENNGVYTVGPVRFDRMGRWTLTFHVYDAAPAKHSHFSFFIDVP